MPGKVDAKNDVIAKAIFTGYNNYLPGKVDAKNDVIAKAIFTGYNNYLSGKVDAKKTMLLPRQYHKRRVKHRHAYVCYL